MAKKGHIPWNKGNRLIPFNVKVCETCISTYIRKDESSNRDWLKQRFCSKKCALVNNKRRKNISWSENEREVRLKSIRRGENHPFWIKDRSLLAKKQERNDYAYCEWRRLVWSRDSFKCRIANESCKGRIEAHHILGWTDFPELRYQVNNGITLCHAHHPRKRAEEKRLIPIFQELVTVSKA